MIPVTLKLLTILLGKPRTRGDDPEATVYTNQAGP